jgi:membrane protein implicated in regulation of membrane protease activity
MALWHVWVIVAIVLFIGEVLTPGFVLACFGVGCLASGVVAYAQWDIKWQLATFSAGTLLMFFTMRPMVLIYLQPSVEVPTNTDRLVGKVGLVTEQVDGHAHTGRVTVCGEDWKAMPADPDASITPGQKIVVLRVESAKLMVRPLAEVEQEGIA